MSQIPILSGKRRFFAHKKLVISEADCQKYNTMSFLDDMPWHKKTLHIPTIDRKFVFKL